MPKTVAAKETPESLDPDPVGTVGEAVDEDEPEPMEQNR